MRKIDIFTHIFPKAYVDQDESGGARLQGRGQARAWRADAGRSRRAISRDGPIRRIRAGALDRHAAHRGVCAAGRRGRSGPPGQRRDGRAACKSTRNGFPVLSPRSRSTIRRRRFAKRIAPISDLGGRGIQLFTNVCGKPLVAPEFLPLFDAMAAFDLPIWLHPYRGVGLLRTMRAKIARIYEIWWTFGWPYETSVAMARIVFAGLFDTYPNLKVITHHMGAMAPYFEGRVGPGWDQLGARTSDMDYTWFSSV